MKNALTLTLAVLAAAVILTGRLTSVALADDKADEAKIKENIAKLPEKDRKLAEEQKYCALEDEHRLGSMGMPIKIEIKGQPVFLCCKGCKDDALANPDKTLAKVKELKEKAKKEAQKQP
jgi:hypothetical protein